MSTFLRYVLLQVPATVVVAAVLAAAVSTGFLALPWAIALLLAWIVKDLALFPLVRKAYEAGDDRGRPPVGCRGVVTRRLDPEGRVRVRGEVWRARLAAIEGTPCLAEGSPVTVLDRDRQTLLVEPSIDPQG
jgi:membrane protein implicated in regulation of membrane protease activity